MKSQRPKGGQGVIMINRVGCPNIQPRVSPDDCKPWEPRIRMTCNLFLAAAQDTKTRLSARGEAGAQLTTSVGSSSSSGSCNSRLSSLTQLSLTNGTKRVFLLAGPECYVYPTVHSSPAKKLRGHKKVEISSRSPFPSQFKPRQLPAIPFQAI